MKAVVSSSFTPPLASTSSDSIFNSSAPTPLSRLQELHLLHTDANEILPEIVNLSSSLQNLSVGYYPHLTSLQKGIGNLSTLGSLEIFRCPNLVTLPQEMANLSSLTSLHILDVGGCPSLKSLPEGIGNLSSLEYLYLSGTSLPQWLHGLTSLKKLSIDGCSSLESLPEEIAQLSTLEWFTLSRCDKLATLPQDLHLLTSLYYLSIRECPLLSQTIKKNRYGLCSKLARIPTAYLDGKRIHAHCSKQKAKFAHFPCSHLVPLLGGDGPNSESQTTVHSLDHDILCVIFSLLDLFDLSDALSSANPDWLCKRVLLILIIDQGRDFAGVDHCRMKMGLLLTCVGEKVFSS
ncbi:hypothetical protein FEM48_Zijuj05G0025200 [Ziziphus jujuba var. spinosa]|uniref:Uncharacterized protein n=1 Tax=Ziziphus jujuba var. spinosa TaxID=714518 RepID=A0A978VCA8_ZIZJJ|nr:hypothetical protein FEM48_Zijuj05G0025200 [Ziziphus jujuba var. spinosa]